MSRQSGPPASGDSDRGARSSALVRFVLEPQAQPFGCVHFTEQEMHESPQAHSGQTMQHPVESS